MTHKKRLKKEIIRSLFISFDELCKNCDECCEKSDCPLVKIRDGFHNIYGNQFIYVGGEKVWIKKIGGDNG